MSRAEIIIAAKDQTAKAFSSVNSGLGKLTGALGSTQAKIAGLIGVGGMGALIKVNADAQDALAKTSDKLQIQHQKLGGLHYATGQIVGDYRGIDEALTKASKRLGEFNATGGGAGAVWLKELNLDTQKLAQLSPDQLFNEYARAIGGLSDRGQQLAAMSALMGDESRKFIGVIDEGPEALEEMSKRAEALGIAITRVDAAQIEAANDALDDAKQVFNGIATTVAVQLSPYVQALAGYFADAAVESNGFKTELVNGVKVMVKSVAFLGDMWRVVEIGIKGVEVVLWGLATTTNTVFATIETAFNGYIEIANLFGGSYKKLDYFNGLMSKGAEETKNAAAEVKALLDAPLPSAKVETFFKEIEEKAKISAQKVADAKNASINNGEGKVSVGVMPDDTDDKLQGRLEKLQASYLSENEQLLLFQEEQQWIIEEAFQAGLIRNQGRDALLYETKSAHLNSMLALDVNHYVKSQKMEAAFWKRKTTTFLSGMQQMTQGLAGESRAMFEINKMATIANVALNIPEAVSGAYAWGSNIGGPPAGAAAAAVALYAQVEQLKLATQQSFGGGGVAPSLSGTGATSVTATVPAVSGLEKTSTNTEDAGQTQAFTVIVNGDIYDGDRFEERLADAYKNLVERDAI